MSDHSDAGRDEIESANTGLNRDIFLRTLVRELAGTLQDVVGLEDASGFVSIVGATIGDDISAAYRRELKVDRLTRQQVASVLVDLKRRIQGDFYIIEDHEDRLVLGARICPFGEHVVGRPSLCMMTSNVFGSIAAENLGYAHVQIEESIAMGHGGCRVVVNLRPGDTQPVDGREYFRGGA